MDLAGNSVQLRRVVNGVGGSVVDYGATVQVKANRLKKERLR